MFLHMSVCPGLEVGVPVLGGGIPQDFWEGMRLLVSPRGSRVGIISIRGGRVLVVLLYFVPETGLYLGISVNCERRYYALLISFSPASRGPQNLF